MDKNPFDEQKNNNLYGDWISMGQLSEEWFVACVAETSKRLLEQMHRIVEPVEDISLIFKFNPTEEKEIFSVTGAWKCYGNRKQ